jgi:hypothetical protein
MNINSPSSKSGIWTRLTLILLAMRGAAFLKIECSQVDEGIFILDSPGLPDCLRRRFGSKAHSSPHKESSAIVWLSLKVIGGHLLDPIRVLQIKLLKRRAQPNQKFKVSQSQVEFFARWWHDEWAEGVRRDKVYQQSVQWKFHLLVSLLHFSYTSLSLMVKTINVLPVNSLSP